MQIAMSSTFFIICITILDANAAALSSLESSTPINCGDQGDCLTASPDCKEKCGCDKFYIYNATTDECLLNHKFLKEELVEKYKPEEVLRINAEHVFRGIVIAAILVVTCASVCVLMACIYCCHINYTDHVLRKDVKALAGKLNRDGKLPKPAKKKIEDAAQSCNVVVEDAGVFVC